MDITELRGQSFALIGDIALWKAGEEARQLSALLEEELRHHKSSMLSAMLAFTRSLERDIDLLAKAGYNPGQPRVSAGNPNGSQWTGSGGSAGSLAAKPDYTRTWADLKTLGKHVMDHGRDFGVTSVKDCAKQAHEFYQRYTTDKLPAVVDRNGVIRVYDPITNTFGSYNANGTTRTYFKPIDGGEYFSREVNHHVSRGGRIVNPVSSAIGPEASPGKPIRGGGIGRIDDELSPFDPLQRHILE